MCSRRCWSDRLFAYYSDCVHTLLTKAPVVTRPCGRVTYGCTSVWTEPWVTHLDCANIHFLSSIVQVPVATWWKLLPRAHILEIIYFGHIVNFSFSNWRWRALISWLFQAYFQILRRSTQRRIRLRKRWWKEVYIDTLKPAVREDQRQHRIDGKTPECRSPLCQAISMQIVIPPTETVKRLPWSVTACNWLTSRSARKMTVDMP